MEVNATVSIRVCAYVCIKIIIQINLLMDSGKSLTVSGPFMPVL